MPVGRKRKRVDQEMGDQVARPHNMQRLMPQVRLLSHPSSMLTILSETALSPTRTCKPFLGPLLRIPFEPPRLGYGSPFSCLSDD